jgi:hypothetical protein
VNFSNCCLFTFVAMCIDSFHYGNQCVNLCLFLVICWLFFGVSFLRWILLVPVCFCWFLLVSVGFYHSVLVDSSFYLNLIYFYYVPTSSSYLNFKLFAFNRKVNLFKNLVP